MLAEKFIGLQKHLSRITCSHKLVFRAALIYVNDLRHGIVPTRKFSGFDMKTWVSVFFDTLRYHLSRARDFTSSWIGTPTIGANTCRVVAWMSAFGQARPTSRTKTRAVLWAAAKSGVSACPPFG